jgi:ATP-dependent Lhr-like helicase
VLQRLEERGRVRRGHFVAGVAALQFALPAVLERLRALRRPSETPEAVVLAAADPANPYGALLRWPSPPGSAARAPSRSVGARVVLVDGAPVGWLARGGRALTAWLPEDEAERARVAPALARALAAEAHAAGRSGLLLEEIDGVAAERHSLAWHLLEAGFAASAHGFHLAPRRSPAAPQPGPLSS